MRCLWSLVDLKSWNTHASRPTSGFVDEPVTPENVDFSADRDYPEDEGRLCFRGGQGKKASLNCRNKDIGKVKRL